MRPYPEKGMSRVIWVMGLQRGSSDSFNNEGRRAVNSCSSKFMVNCLLVGETNKNAPISKGPQRFHHDPKENRSATDGSKTLGEPEQQDAAVTLKLTDEVSYRQSPEDLWTNRKQSAEGGDSQTRINSLSCPQKYRIEPQPSRFTYTAATVESQ